MKTRNRIWICSLIGLGLILTNSCKKNNDNDNSIKDGEGNIYTSVTIGTQVWLKQNLITAKFNDGTAIPFVADGPEWAALTTPGYCWHENSTIIDKIDYGALYNQYSVNTGKLCPTGWHVPTDAEWTTLTTYLGGEDIAGGKLKETTTLHWAYPNEVATNESSFTALPGGGRFNHGAFYDFGINGYWWSSTNDLSTTVAYSRAMVNKYGNVNRNFYPMFMGFSVRCLKN